MTTIVAVDSLTKSYRRHLALNDVSFSIEAGESVGLVGPNGAGKSTLLRTICGAIRPTSGSLSLFNDRPNAFKRPGERLGFVFDPPGIPRALTPRAYLRIEASSQGLDRDIAEAAIDTFNIEAYSNRRYGKLSTGQRQRVSLAAATLGRPALLVLDEPTNGLDIEAIQWLRSLVESRTSGGLTTIISTHNLPELERMTTRTLVLNTTLRFDGVSLSKDPDKAEQHYISLISNLETAAS